MHKNNLKRLFFTPFLAFLAACGGDSGNTNNSNDCMQIATQTKKTSSEMEMDIYVENSASMFGYLEGQTEFKSVLMDLPFRMKDKGLKTNFFFINDKSYPIDKDFKVFIESLNSTEAKKYGKTDASQLDLMLETMINNALKTGKSAFLASDFVYDVRGKKPTDELQNLENKIKNSVNKLKNQGWGLLVLRLKSQFNGTYYDLNDKKTQLKGEQRPYYIWICGHNQLLQTFTTEYNVSTLKGFELANLYQQPANIQPYVSILPTSEKKGSFTRKAGKGAVTELINVEGVQGSREFQLSLAVNLSEIPVPADYLTNTANYQLKSDLNAQIVSITPVSNAKIQANDRRFLCEATHVFVINIPSLIIKTASADFNLQLLQKTPDWVNNLHTDDDSNIKAILNKSFGLKNLIAGVENGFNPSQEQLIYANFGFKLNK